MNPFLTALEARRDGRTNKRWAQDLNISESGLSRILRGHSDISSSVLRKILTAHPDLFPIWLKDDGHNTVNSARVSSTCAVA